MRAHSRVFLQANHPYCGTRVCRSLAGNTRCTAQRLAAVGPPSGGGHERHDGASADMVCRQRGTSVWLHRHSVRRARPPVRRSGGLDKMEAWRTGPCRAGEDSGSARTNEKTVLAMSRRNCPRSTHLLGIVWTIVPTGRLSKFLGLGDKMMSIQMGR